MGLNSDRRDASRRICLITTIVHRVSSVFKSTAINFSRTGCFFQSNQIPEIGEEILFEFPAKGRRTVPVYILGDVVRACDKPDPKLMVTGFAVKWRKIYSPGGEGPIKSFIEQVFMFLPPGKEWKLVDTAEFIAPSLPFGQKEQEVSKKPVLPKKTEEEKPKHIPVSPHRVDTTILLKDSENVSIPLKFWVGLESFDGTIYRLGSSALVIFSQNPPNVGKKVEFKITTDTGTEKDEIKISGTVENLKILPYGAEFVVRITTVQEVNNKGSFERYIKYLKER